jgi:hypothetical protein
LAGQARASKVIFLARPRTHTAGQFQSLATGGFLASCQAIVARDEAHACTACMKTQAREKAVEVEEVVEPSA